MPYAELHCHSNFSFLDGASHPEELAEEAARLGLDAIALTDHDGMYGVVRFAEAAKAHGVRTIYGAELSLGLTEPQSGHADPEGKHLLVLARDTEGYGRLCRQISAAQLGGGTKGRPVYDADELAGAHDGHWLVLTGCRKGAVPAALAARRARPGWTRPAARSTSWSAGSAGTTWRSSCGTTATRWTTPATTRWPSWPPAAGWPPSPPATRTTPRPRRRRLATALAAVRARRSLDEMDGWLPAAGTAHLRSGAEMAARFARFPGAVQRAAELGLACSFDLHLVAPQLPDWDIPAGHTR